MEILREDAVDPAEFPSHFLPLAENKAFLEACFQALETAPVADGFSRTALLLFDAGQKEDARELWKRDIASGSISWWQHNRYLVAVFEMDGYEAAAAVLEQIEQSHPDRKNSRTALGMMLLRTNPQQAEKLMKQDAAAGRLTAGFKLNYACALSAAERMAEAIRTVEEAYAERQSLNEGFIRIARAAPQIMPRVALDLFRRDMEHGPISLGADEEYIHRLRTLEGIESAIEWMEQIENKDRAQHLYLLVLNWALRQGYLFYADRLQQSATHTAIDLKENYNGISQVMESIRHERSQQQYHFCTIITPNYLCYALALHESLIEHNDCAVLHVLLCPNGTEDQSRKYASDSLRFYYSDDLCTEGTAKALSDKYHGKYEDGFRWAMKSVMLTYLLTKEDCDKVFFVDCDIFFFDDYTFLFDELDDCAMIVSPHWKPYSEPGKDKTFIYEELFYNGMFNAGFVGVSQNGLDHLDWWARACLFNCYKDITNGFFVDQTHLTVLQAHFDDVKILKHRGCNVAHWNELESPRIRQEDGTVLIQGKYPIVFCHFALLCPDRYINGADKHLHVYFWKYVHCLKKHGLTRLRALFTQLDSQLSALIWMLKESGINEVSLPGNDEDVSAWLERKGITAHAETKFKTVVLVCERGSAAEAESTLNGTVEKEDLFIIERESTEPIEEEVFVASAPQRFMQALSELQAEGRKRIMIYGGGMHTPKMLSRPLDLADMQLVGVVDDAPEKNGLWLCGLTVVSAEEAKQLDADAVIVSSDTIEDILFEQACATFPELPVYRLYGEDRDA